MYLYGNCFLLHWAVEFVSYRVVNGRLYCSAGLNLEGGEKLPWLPAAKLLFLKCSNASCLSRQFALCGTSVLLWDRINQFYKTHLTLHPLSCKLRTTDKGHGNRHCAANLALHQVKSPLWRKKEGLSSYRRRRWVVQAHWSGLVQLLSSLKNERLTDAQWEINDCEHPK